MIPGGVRCWVEDPLGKYCLYFAHRQGTFFRLAYAERLGGPRWPCEPGTLSLGELHSLHARTELHPMGLGRVRTLLSTGSPDSSGARGALALGWNAELRAQ